MNQLSNLKELNERKHLIANNPKFKVVCFNFAEGEGLPSHHHEGFATIQIIEGAVSMNFENGEAHHLESGMFLAFDARMTHDVIAKTQTKILVTISERL